MKSNPKAAPRILALEPEGFRGHMNFNAFFLRVLGMMGPVTLISPQGYLNSCTVDMRIDIPAALERHRTKIGARWSQIRALNYILRNIRLDDYAAIVFLAYETISLSLRWPRDRTVFLFEHNNIENARGSKIKTFFYKHLSPNTIHLVLQRHIARHIRETYSRRSIYIPFPNSRIDVSDSGVCANSGPPYPPKGRTVIFSPSGSTPRLIQDKLKSFASDRENVYYAICKGEPEEKTSAYEVRPFFDNYEDLMSGCDMVFFGARFDCHVSSVAYEALSYGKPVILLDSPFARELQEDYPHLVFPIDRVIDIPKVITNPERIKKEHARFLREHSFDAVRTDMVRALNV